MKYRILPLLPLMLAGAILLQGCDWVAGKASVDKVDASLGSVGANLVITPNGASSNSGTVNVGDADLPDVFDVESITIEQSNVQYTAIAGKTGEWRQAARSIFSSSSTRRRPSEPVSPSPTIS